MWSDSISLPDKLKCKQMKWLFGVDCKCSFWPLSTSVVPKWPRVPQSTHVLCCLRFAFFFPMMEIIPPPPFSRHYNWSLGKPSKVSKATRWEGEPGAHLLDSVLADFWSGLGFAKTMGKGAMDGPPHVPSVGLPSHWCGSRWCHTPMLLWRLESPHDIKCFLIIN